MSSKAFDQLFAQHAMASYAKQLALADVLEGAGSWAVDLKESTLTFADGPTFGIGMLGTFADDAGTWLWSWANPGAKEWPERLTSVAKRMRELGTRDDIDELRDAKTPTTDDFCHRIAMVAVGETGAGAYYRGPYDGGAAFFVIQEPLPVDEKRHHLGRVQRVIAESISTFDLPHRTALEAYFTAENFKVTSEDDSENSMIAVADDGDLRIRFDEDGRITEMKSLLRAATKPSGGFFNRLFRKD